MCAKGLKEEEGSKSEREKSWGSEAREHTKRNMDVGRRAYHSGACFSPAQAAWGTGGRRKERGRIAGGVEAEEEEQGGDRLGPRLP